MEKPLVGILALQGAFREHIAMLRQLGARTREIRQAKDLSGLDAIVLPGGESTTVGRLLNILGMLDPLRDMIAAGLPAFGTCAGLILLCREIVGSEQPRLGLLDASVERNAFGRQVDSFEAFLAIPALGEAPFPAVFIRAPLILTTEPNVDILATLEQNGLQRPVAVRQANILAASFHPELTDDSRMHRYFLRMAQ